ncbi:RYamide receptor [Megalopta genalis]|uniref:RYamide receptor n=1 Tax=Megalopta genalis TaxID=115081 RepID=UPI00144368D1|nr:RYamide receptor-like [Megalopta genalis]XP_033335363.1 RYamide receptor-like [Megalopta genalis]XP_033335364.1 RYamide receptor-like [Megalopta genalis]XP_033335366.1 RYamide receptor-like [Megalopta genalis]XP_033335367.1 RYamide receptor-like [Megalopta genalis]XP_033335368.1 RYamide receptor-like [Megalopta genalis]XP_033335369.1 RYamide receptor-like [Megalopta genalis]XP_033335370.1 RYamide receptor-like [Megalopta genalis]XP_033335371.1 RYamide receptor-like [Megalopta genalis]XP
MDAVTMNDSSLYSNDTSMATARPFERPYEVPTLHVVFLSILYGSLAFLTLIGNSLVMWIIAASKRMQSVTNFYIANLAVADIVIGLFVIPFQFQAALLQRWDLPHFLCAFCPYVKTLSVSVSVFTLTAIAIDRHRSILQPLKPKPSKRTAKIVIIGIWVIGAILSIPMAIALEVRMVSEDPDDANSTHRKPFCGRVNLSMKTMFIYQGLLLVILRYLIPLIVISCVYARMVVKLWSNRAPGNAEDSRDANLMRNKMRVIKMFIIVVAVFALCWLPLQTYEFLQYCYPINHYEYINYIYFICDWLAMSNSCYNPLIYGIYNGKFRREFQQRCPIKSRKWSSTTPNDNTELDKTQSSRASIRYEWRRTISGTYPTVTSFCKGIPVRESSQSFIEKHETCRRSKKGIGHYFHGDNENRCSISSNKTEELYVFSSRKHGQDPDTEELCL